MVYNLYSIGKVSRVISSEYESDFLALTPIVIMWECDFLGMNFYLIKKGHNNEIEITQGESYVLKLSNHELELFRQKVGEVSDAFEYALPKDFMEFLYDKYFLQ